jgi:hypothetical protein
VIAGPGERYAITHGAEASAWVAFRLPALPRWRLAGVASAGRGRYALYDLDGQTYRRSIVTWTGAAGVGYGPAFVLFGFTGPSVKVRGAPDAPGLGTERMALVSLNVVFDLLSIASSSKYDT